MGLWDAIFGGGGSSQTSTSSIPQRSAAEQAIIDQIAADSGVFNPPDLMTPDKVTTDDFNGFLGSIFGSHKVRDNILWGASLSKDDNGNYILEGPNTYGKKVFNEEKGKLLKRLMDASGEGFDDKVKNTIVDLKNETINTEAKKRQDEFNAKYNQTSPEAQAEALKLQQDEQKIQNLFKQATINYLSRAAGGQIDQDALRAATEFVDQTFTRPAEEQLRLAQSDYERAQGQRAAALGRNVTDSTYNTQLFQNAANQRAQLGAARGAAIQDQYVNQPMRDLQTGLLGLQGVSSGIEQRGFAPQFLNTLNQQAQSNRLNLLNLMQGDRANNKTITQTSQGPDIGLLGKISQVGQLGASIYGGVSGMGGLSGIGSSIGPGLQKFWSNPAVGSK